MRSGRGRSGGVAFFNNLKSRLDVGDVQIRKVIEGSWGEEGAVGCDGWLLRWVWVVW